MAKRFLSLSAHSSEGRKQVFKGIRERAEKGEGRDASYYKSRERNASKHKALKEKVDWRKGSESPTRGGKRNISSL